MKIAIGTRFWGVNPEKDLPRLEAFVRASKEIGPTFVAINAEEDKVDTVSKFPEAFPVTPWGKFVQPLNALILKGAAAEAEFLLLASAEFPPTQALVDTLLSHVTLGTLVVGAAFAEHNLYNTIPCRVQADGAMVPWNTFALWNLEHLTKLGIPLVGDAPFDPKMAGVEEVATIALYQRIWPSLKAKLVKIPGFGGEWNTTGWSAERLEKHRKKIQSKIDRPKAQLDYAGLSRPIVQHIG